MGIKLPGLKRNKKKWVAYFFYRPLTKAWSETPGVLLSGLDGSRIIIEYRQDKLVAESDKGLVYETMPLSPLIVDEADLFNQFNKFITEAYQSEVILGPVNGGPVYLDMSERWTITSDVCREFLESVFYNVTGTIALFR